MSDQEIPLPQDQKPKKAKRRKLTRREKALFRATLKGKTLTQAAIEAGYSENSARQAGSAAMQRIQEKAPDLFARHGLDDDSFIDKYVLPALTAEETRIFQHEGALIYSEPMVAWSPRVRTMELVARMKGLDSREREGPQVGIKVLVINSSHRPPQERT